MEMSVVPIRVESDYDYGQYRDFFIFNFFRGKYYQLNMLLDLAGVPALYALIKMFLFFRTATLAFGLFDALYLVFYLLLLLYVLLGPRFNYRQAGGPADTAITVDFGEEAFTVCYEGAAPGEEDSHRYGDLYRVYDLPEMFYLYVSPSHAYLLRKACLRQGEAGVLQALLSEKVPTARFVHCTVFGRKASVQ